MNSTRTVAVRLDNQVAQEYERLAQLKGDKLGTYLRDLLTSNLQMASIERQANRIETLVNDFEKQINYLDKFTEANYLNEKFFEDFGHIYMFQIGILMHLKVDRGDIQGMQTKEMHMPKRTILREKAMSNIIQLSKPCAFCDSRENVQLFAGLMLCGNCQENIRITNPGMFEANDQIEQKAQD
jgi:hypothetical protein